MSRWARGEAESPVYDDDGAAPVTEGDSLVLPSGALVDMTIPDDVALAITDLDQLIAQAKQAKAILTEALDDEARRRGLATYQAGVFQIRMHRNRKTVWPDTVELRDGLRAAGCPEDRINDLIRQTVSEGVNGTVARQLASNPVYAAVIERCKTIVDLPVRAEIVRADP